MLRILLIAGAIPDHQLHLELTRSRIGHRKEPLCIPNPDRHMVALFYHEIRILEAEILFLETRKSARGLSAFVNLPVRGWQPAPERKKSPRKGNILVFER